MKNFLYGFAAGVVFIGVSIILLTPRAHNFSPSQLLGTEYAAVMREC